MYFNNQSGTPVTVLSSTITGADASSYSIQPGQDFCTLKTLPAFSSCHLNVIFFAQANGPGPKNDATLVLTDNALLTCSKLFSTENALYAGTARVVLELSTKATISPGVYSLSAPGDGGFPPVNATYYSVNADCTSDAGPGAPST